MNTTFLLSGGAGRIICAVPALEKYHKLNPNDDFKVLVPAWDMLFWSNPILQDRTFEANQKGNFDLHVKNNQLISPEPYFHFKFYTQQIHLTESFDELINNTEDHSDLKHSNYLYLTELEKTHAKKNINYYKTFKQKNKVIVFQPFGSSVEVVEENLIDQTNRSLSRKSYFEIVKKLSQHAAIVYMGPQQFRSQEDDISIYLNDDPYYIRNMIATISECDYFVGIDSLGQHIAKSFNVPGLVLMGGTDERNISYPNHFKIYRKRDVIPNYIPMRISDTDSNYANRINDGAMDLSENEINNICKTIVADLNRGKNG